MILAHWHKWFDPVALRTEEEDGGGVQGSQMMLSGKGGRGGGGGGSSPPAAAAHPASLHPMCSEGKERRRMGSDPDMCC